MRLWRGFGQGHHESPGRDTDGPRTSSEGGGRLLFWRSSNTRSTLLLMGDRERDQAIVSRLYTIATRTWAELTGPDRDDRVAALTAAADGRTDLLAEAAGILLGTRPDDEYDPRYRQRTAGAEMLLDAAGVRKEERAEAVRQWVPVGEERRARWRRPVDRGGIA